jgi:hypothetical protein
MADAWEQDLRSDDLTAQAASGLAQTDSGVAATEELGTGQRNLRRKSIPAVPPAARSGCGGPLSEALSQPAVLPVS